MTKQQPAPASSPPNNKGIDINEVLTLLDTRGQVLLGRSAEFNNIVISHPNVSRRHAILSKQGNSYFVEDDGSLHGTFIAKNRNGQLEWVKVEKETEVALSDRIRIGPFEFALQEKGSVAAPYAIQGYGLSKTVEIPISVESVRKGTALKKLRILHPMDLKVPANEFVALMGPSGCGKTTLLRCLIGSHPATEGQVLVQGLPLTPQNFERIKRDIGYVPQHENLHPGLTLEQTLFYGAKLRLPKNMSRDAIKDRIEEVLETLGISKHKGKRIEKLSGGQKKRASIALELLNQPQILFLDEPTSPLDPESIKDFLTCVKGLTNKGMTVVMVTHKPSDLDFVDKVIFLSSGGYLTFCGNKKSFLQHFKTEDITEIYETCNNQEQGRILSEAWQNDNSLSEAPILADHIPKRRPESILHQLKWLSLRFLSVKMSNGSNLFFLGFQPLLIALLMTQLLYENLQGSVLFLTAISAIWFGVNNAAREIVDEKVIYERERMYNLNIWNYLISKIIVLTGISFIQVLAFIGILWQSYSHSDSALAVMHNFWWHVGWMLLLAFVSTLLGLFLSTACKSAELVMTVVPLVLIPQIMLSGVIAPLKTTLQNLFSYFTYGRWGTEGFARIQDHSPDGVSLPAINQLDLSNKLVPAKAMESFQFKHEQWPIFNSLNSNALALLILGLVFSLLSFWLLKRKDQRFSI